VPVTVEYALTTLGETLTERIAPLLHWAEDHIPEIKAAQAAYDARQSEAA
jgi:DNA-binding HxlR family transcriptional regulator